jgi:hypothetical protein
MNKGEVGTQVQRFSGSGEKKVPKVTIEKGYGFTVQRLVKKETGFLLSSPFNR